MYKEMQDNENHMVEEEAIVAGSLLWSHVTKKAFCFSGKDFKIL